MKTFYHRPLTHQKAREHQQKLEADTQVKWDWYSTAGGTAFTPIITKATTQDEVLALQLLPHLTKEYQNFLTLASTSGLSLSQTLIAAKTLVYTQRAVPTVNRMGNLAAIRRA